MQFPFLSLTEIGLFIFLILFLGMVVWTAHPANSAKYSHLADLPLDNDAQEVQP